MSDEVFKWIVVAALIFIVCSDFASGWILGDILILLRRRFKDE